MRYEGVKASPLPPLTPSAPSNSMYNVIYTQLHALTSHIYNRVSFQLNFGHGLKLAIELRFSKTFPLGKGFLLFKYEAPESPTRDAVAGGNSQAHQDQLHTTLSRVASSEAPGSPHLRRCRRWELPGPPG